MTTETPTNLGCLTDLAQLCGVDTSDKSDAQVISQIYYITKNFRDKVTEVTEKQAIEIARWKDMYQTLIRILLDVRQGLTMSPN